jgi:23S rRNA pseudouridine955/2504/2580 synthase
MREIVLPAKESPKKLENFLKRQFPIGYVRKLFRKRSVRINGRRAKADDLVKSGDRVQLYLPFKAEEKVTTPIGKATKLEVVFEDEAILVINKPAGLAVHEGKTVSKRESILGILEKRYRDSPIRPRLVHRLDKDTSGLLIVAKNQQAADAFIDTFESGDTGKEYLCMVVGKVPYDDGKIDFPLPGRTGNLVRAVTRYRIIKRFAETTLVRATIETGRLHQIRLHFAELGYPVVMDDQHGDFGFNKRFRKEYGLKRQFLHAQRLTLNYAGKLREWTASLPKDLRKTLTTLERQQGSA